MRGPRRRHPPASHGIFCAPSPNWKKPPALMWNLPWPFTQMEWEPAVTLRSCTDALLMLKMDSVVSASVVTCTVVGS
jgi:hypothetical protein